MLQLVFDKAILKQNIAAIKRRSGSALIYAALLNDGFGAGLVALATALREDGIGHFAVSEVEDARKLRKAGFVEEEILMLRSTTDPEELGQLLDLNVVCTVGSYETGVALNALAEERSTVAVAHVLVDTGTGLGGFLPSEPKQLLSIYKYLPNVAIAGTYTQLRSSGKEAAVQMDQLRLALTTLRDAGVDPGLIHASNPYALLRAESLELDAVLVGAAFLGQGQRRKGDGVRKVCHGEVTLDTICWLPKGHTVGTGQQVRLKRPTRVAVISLGYCNGFGQTAQPVRGLLAHLRAWRNAKYRRVNFRGTKLHLIGPVGADLSAIDVTNADCAVDDTVTFDIDPTFARGMARVFR
jgi:alanine racemase